MLQTGTLINASTNYPSSRLVYYYRYLPKVINEVKIIKDTEIVLVCLLRMLGVTGADLRM